MLSTKLSENLHGSHIKYGTSKSWTWQVLDTKQSTTNDTDFCQPPSPLLCGVGVSEPASSVLRSNTYTQPVTAMKQFAWHPAAYEHYHETVQQWSLFQEQPKHQLDFRKKSPTTAVVNPVIFINLLHVQPTILYICDSINQNLNRTWKPRRLSC